MARKNLLSQKNRVEITHAFKSGDFTKDELAHMYGVSKATIHNTLVDAGLANNASRKTPKEIALLQTLSLFGITDITQLKERLMHKPINYQDFLRLPLETRINWFTQSMVSPVQPPELTDFSHETTTNQTSRTQSVRHRQHA